MPKHFKLKFPRVIPLIQFCRPKRHATLPAIYRLSPINAKAVDIGYPKLLPAPPLSTPENPAAKRRLSSKTAKSIGCGSFRTRSCAQYFADCSMEMKSSPISETEKYYRKKRKEEKKKTTKTARAELPSTTTSSGNYGNWFSGEFEYDEENEESGTPIYSSGSFSNEFSLVLESIGEKMAEKQSALQKQSRKKASNAKPAASGGGGEIGKIREVLMPIRVCRGNAEKVRESVAVVKKSEDPYEDFKRSMVEMIMEKQIFGAKELEELLHCFLTLKSRHYQGVIVEAFSEIWELLFSSDPSDHQLAGKSKN